ncbi:MAG: tRNA (N(6)-L-threonylcarbamoyladenosine(37)-C(2))-methylthiotransferase MtaB [Lachnospiraceae bacterium]|nr:tRNA (N(6)-L-threonylcarbamoyladenosine(37)-C(2))-methylthiotransferase MtaB [Lachnospiraceae bacterium]
MKTIAFHNLGCKVNSYEADVMQQMLQNSNYEIVQFEQKADIYVINTCSVTNIADRKSRQMIHRASKANPDAVVVAVGCYVQADALNIAQDESVDLLIGNNRKKDIAEILDEYFEHREYAAPEDDEKTANYLRKTLGNTTVVDVKKVDYEDALLSETAEHTRAYIKIQDGCNRFCSYCIIPYTRGRVRSRKPDSIVNEVKELCSKGYREFVLTGIHISSYGFDFKCDTPGEHILSLLARINETEGVERIRIGSFEPMIITEEFAKGLAQIDKLCPHFHISLQSGCDETLKRMNRRYTSAEYEERVRILRNVFPEAAITTDVIVGFPGETEEEFNKTTEFLKRVNFYEMHIFKYSKRKGTVAASMDGQIDESVKSLRSDVCEVIERKQSEEFRKRFIGRTVSVIFEEEKEILGKKYWVGYTPEYIRVAYECNENMQNVSANIEIVSMITPEIALGK